MKIAILSWHSGWSKCTIQLSAWHLDGVFSSKIRHHEKRYWYILANQKTEFCYQLAIGPWRTFGIDLEHLPSCVSLVSSSSKYSPNLGNTVTRLSGSGTEEQTQIYVYGTTAMRKITTKYASASVLIFKTYLDNVLKEAKWILWAQIVHFLLKLIQRGSCLLLNAVHITPAIKTLTGWYSLVGNVKRAIKKQLVNF